MAGRLSRARWLALAGGILIVAAVVVGVNVGLAAADLTRARSATTQAGAALEDTDLDTARTRLDEAATSFERGAAQLGNPAGVVAGWVPVAGRNVRAARTLAEAGALATAAVAGPLDAVEELPGGLAALAPSGGRLPLDALAALAPALAEAADDAERAAALAAAAPDRGLVARVAEARADFLAEVVPLRDGLSAASALAEGLPAFLGADGPRRYFFAAANPAEQRGTGGFLGAWTTLTLDRGRLEFGEFVQIHDLIDVPPGEIEAPDPDYAARYDRYGGAGTWMNINMTPDFPTAATAIERLYEHTMGDRLDGTIVADPIALQALLEVGEPIDAPVVGEINAGNVVELLANEAYDAFDSNEERKRVLGAVAAEIVTGFLRGGADPAASVRALADATGGRHLLLHAADPDVQEALETAGVAGQVVDPDGDYLAVVANNAAANKADFSTERTVFYRVELAEGGVAGAGLRVRLHNRTPAEGLPGHVIGPNAEGLEAGDNQLLLSAYCAPGCEVADLEVAGDPVDPQVESELGRPVSSTALRVASEEVVDLQWRWTLTDVWAEHDTDTGRYTLVVQDQPTIQPTTVVVEVQAPAGMVISSASAGMTVDGTEARWEGTARGTMTFTVDIERPMTRWERIRRFLGQPLFGRAGRPGAGR